MAAAFSPVVPVRPRFTGRIPENEAIPLPLAHISGLQGHLPHTAGDIQCILRDTEAGETLSQLSHERHAGAQSHLEMLSTLRIVKLK